MPPADSTRDQCPQRRRVPRPRRAHRDVTPTWLCASDGATTMLGMPDSDQLELLRMPDLGEPRLRAVTPPADIMRVMARWQATEIFDEYWRFAARRQAILMRRLAGLPPPWTSDRILLRHRFTNPYRLTDRVSQYMLRSVQYDEVRTPAGTVFRTLLFKIFNRIDTWKSLV